jgi:hypothetical protein
MATLYKTDGSSHEIHPQAGDKFTLDEMQAFVGGYIEEVYLMNGQIMIVNEEGRLTCLLYNPGASQIALAYAIPTDYIVGDVVVCERQEWV